MLRRSVFGFFLILRFQIQAEPPGSSETSQLPDFQRFGCDLQYEEVAADGWNLSLGSIVVQLNQYDDPGDPNFWWTFARAEMGIATPVTFEIRDRKGILSGIKFVRHGDLIFIEQQGNSRAPILFAVLGETDSGDEDTGWGGENLHRKIKFTISGLRVVLEKDFKKPTYSLLLPDDAEEVFSKGQRLDSLPGEYAAKLQPQTIPDPQTIVADRSIDQSIDIDARSRTGFLQRALASSSVRRAVVSLVGTSACVVGLRALGIHWN